MSLSREELRIALDESRVGEINRFRIDFVPRLGFRLIGEETLIRLIHGAVAVFPEWSVESVAFLPVDGDSDGVKVTLRREKRIAAVLGASVLAITPLLAAVAIVTAVAFVYSVHKVTRLGAVAIEAAPGAVSTVASGFQIGALAALAGVGFLIYKAVIE